MEWKPWLYTPLLGTALIQGAMCISGTKDVFVFNSDKRSGPQSLFIVTQTLGLICNAFQAWKSFWWNGVHVSSVQSVSHVWLFVTHELQHSRPPCPWPSPRVHPNSRPLSQWCHPAISSSAVPFSSHPQSFPASGSFQMSQLFPLGGQSTGASASASIFPINIQGWFPLGLTGLISYSPRDSQESFPAL